MIIALPGFEPVLLDVGDGSRLDRWTPPEGGHTCRHCGLGTIWMFRRTWVTFSSRGADDRQPKVRLEQWRDQPYCTILCAERAVRCGNFELEGRVA